MNAHQIIRLADAALIGPLMMMGGDCIKHKNPTMGIILYWSGWGAMLGGAVTFVYFGLRGE